MDSGDEKMERGAYQEALSLYAGAHEIMHVPTTGIELARAYAAMGKLVEARDAALDVLRIPAASDEPKAFSDARVVADRMARELAAQIPLLHVEIAPAEAASHSTLRIDGREVPAGAAGLPQALNPTEHELQVAASGFTSFEQRFVLAKGEKRRLRVVLGRSDTKTPMAPGISPAQATTHSPTPPDGAAVPPEHVSGPPWPSWVGFGVGASGLALGTVAGVISLSKTSAAKSHCIGTKCESAAQADLDAAILTANLSNAGFVLGIAGIGVGITTWWIASRRTDSAPATISLAPIRQGGLLTVEGSL